MNAAKVTAEDYIQFTIASPKVFSGTEAARVSTTKPRPPSHDAYSRLLTRLEPDSEDLWTETQPLIRLDDGVLVLDDSTLDKPHARFMPLVGTHWSGKHHRVVRGINLLTTLWTDGEALYPCDYRVYRKTVDLKTKNDHFRDMLDVAAQRGLKPKYVLFDAWYAGLENFKHIRSLGWTFLTRLKSNRRVSVDRGPARALAEQAITAAGTVVWLPGYGELKVFRIVATNGDTSHWATNDLELTSARQEELAGWSWNIEEFHRGLKQHTGVERCAVRRIRGQLNHIGLSIRAFVRLEYHRIKSGISWFQAKTEICREAVRKYLLNPLFQLPKLATA
jgi:putative transposase